MQREPWLFGTIRQLVDQTEEDRDRTALLGLRQVFEECLEVSCLDRTQQSEARRFLDSATLD